MTDRVEQPVSEAQELDPRSAGEAQVSADEAPDAPTDEVTLLRNDLQNAQAEAASNYDKFLRSRADMENYRKRMERTLADLSRTSKKEMLGKLLPVKDNLERALQYGESSNSSGESIIEGVRLTQYQLDSLLQQEGVAPIEAQGKIFDPHLEEAIQRVNDPSVPDHTVVQVVRTGYTYGDEVLRPAQVIVSVHSDEDDV
jgi:molecular chaperone GrpE